MLNVIIGMIVFVILFFLYKDIIDDIEAFRGKLREIQMSIGESDTTLQENDRNTHNTLDVVEKHVRILTEKTQNGFSEMEKYIAVQTALQNHAADNQMSPAELLAHVEATARRVAQAETVAHERDQLKQENEKLREQNKALEKNIQVLKHNIQSLSLQIQNNINRPSVGRDAQNLDSDIGDDFENR